MYHIYICAFAIIIVVTVILEKNKKHDCTDNLEKVIYSVELCKQQRKIRFSQECIDEAFEKYCKK